MKKYDFVIVGGSTAGMIAAGFFAARWNDLVNVTVIYDHKNPGVGVGESLTPNIYSFLNTVGITREDMITNVNATVKLGLKFKNWLNDGKYFYHNFAQKRDEYSYPFAAAYDITHGIYDNDYSYSNNFMELSRVNINPGIGAQSLHIDATIFSKFIEKRLGNSIKVIDGIVKKVNKTGDIINSVILADGRKIDGDFFVDATGFESVLFKELTNEWIDKTDWLPINRCIPNPIPWEFEKQPVYTTSEATNQGWILQVPLSNRWGTGYLYCNEFISDDEAFNNFEKFLETNYGKNKLNNKSKVLKFKSGYWKKQWVGNCIAIGLASGFAEPLEATNIFHTIYQIESFMKVFNFKVFEFDINFYNDSMYAFYDSVYLYLRFCYTTNRIDSNFWQYMTNNTPNAVKQIEQKIQHDITDKLFNNPEAAFNFPHFMRVAYGLKKINVDSWKQQLINRKILDNSRVASLKLIREKMLDFNGSVDHLEYIQSVLNKSKYRIRA